MCVGHIDNTFTTLLAASGVLEAAAAGEGNATATAFMDHQRYQQQQQEKEKGHSEALEQVGALITIGGNKRPRLDKLTNTGAGGDVLVVGDHREGALGASSCGSSSSSGNNIGNSYTATSAPATDIDVSTKFGGLDHHMSAIDACVHALHCCSDVDILCSTLYATAGLPIDHHDPVYPDAYAAAITSRAVSVAKGTGIQECLQYAKFAGLKQVFQPVYNSKGIALRKERARYEDYLQRLQYSMYDDHCISLEQGVGSGAGADSGVVYAVGGRNLMNTEVIPFVRLIATAAAAAAVAEGSGLEMDRSRGRNQGHGHGHGVYNTQRHVGPSHSNGHYQRMTGSTGNGNTSPASRLYTLASSHRHLLQCMELHRGVYKHISYQQTLPAALGPILVGLHTGTDTGQAVSGACGGPEGGAVLSRGVIWSDAHPSEATGKATDSTVQSQLQLELDDEITEF